MLDLARHDDIKARLKRRGVSISQLARNIGVEQSTVTIVSQGHRTSDRIQRAIAACLETTPEDLFPERYQREEER